MRFEAATDITLDDEAFEIDWDSTMGQTMLHGPSTAPSEFESESDVMSGRHERRNRFGSHSFSGSQTRANPTNTTRASRIIAVPSRGGTGIPSRPTDPDQLHFSTVDQEEEEAKQPGGSRRVDDPYGTVAPASAT